MTLYSTSKTDHGAVGDGLFASRMAEWFAAVFMGPLSSTAIQVQQEPPAREALQHMCTALGQPKVAARLLAHLTDEEPHTAAVDLERQYTRLFSGVDGPRTVPLYESAYSDGGPLLFGKPVSEMQATLRQLDFSVTENCQEPPDHLAIELAALALALRHGNDEAAEALLARLRAWTPEFRRRLRSADAAGFYHGAASLLESYVDTIRRSDRTDCDSVIAS